MELIGKQVQDSCILERFIRLLMNPKVLHLDLIFFFAFFIQMLLPRCQRLTWKLGSFLLVEQC